MNVQKIYTALLTADLAGAEGWYTSRTPSFAIERCIGWYLHAMTFERQKQSLQENEIR